MSFRCVDAAPTVVASILLPRCRRDLTISFPKSHTTKSGSMPLPPAAAFLSTTSRIHSNTGFAIMDYYSALTCGGIVPWSSSLMSLQGTLADKLARKVLAGEQADR